MNMDKPQSRDFIKGTRIFHPRVEAWGTVVDIQVIGMAHNLIWLTIQYDDDKIGQCHPKEVYLAGDEVRGAYLRDVDEGIEDEDEDDQPGGNV